MRAADGVSRYGEWLPDQPALNNPGVTDLNNVLPVDGAYIPFKNLNGQGYSDALSARPIGAIVGNDISGTAGRLFAATTTTLQQLSATLSTWSNRTPGAGWNTVVDYVRFAQFDNYIIVTAPENSPHFFDMNLAVNFAALASTGTAPRARQIGVIGQFVLLGDTNGGTSGSGNHHLQWCVINDVRNWPTPGSAAAIAGQAGEEYMPAALGQIRGIASGDQFGLILQVGGVNRATYEGGNTVFRFDPIERGRGCFFPNATVQVGGLTYFVHQGGFLVCDGVQVHDIGAQKVNKHFSDDVDHDNFARMYGGADIDKKLIYWAYPNASATSGRPNRIIVYNYEEKRFTKASPDIECEVLTTGRLRDNLANPSLHAFSETFVAGYYRGDQENPVYITGPEVELNPGLLTTVQGVAPVFEGYNGATVAVGTRSAQAGDTTPTYTAETSVTTATGFADFRSTARYHRARVTTSNAFTKALGVKYQAVPAGAR